MKRWPIGELVRVSLLVLLGYAPIDLAAASSGLEPANVYSTWGVHNDAHADDCGATNCSYARKAHDPGDPVYPPFWTSQWVMYRVFQGYGNHPPPYDGRPPAPFREGTDYQSSRGVTYYDSLWRGPQGDGAMEEHYEKYCLPIFRFSNHYSCSFISLGDIAFFITYDDRPTWMPPVCLFSPNNRPPARDFIKHLPYAREDGARLGGLVNGYSFWIGSNGKPYQIGASPDQTAQHGILFGYAFYSKSTPPDRIDRSAAPYAHPHSFYFSGVPYSSEAPVPNAPIVSQNYTDFAMLRPDPTKTWDAVMHLDPQNQPPCHLFDSPAGREHTEAGAGGS